LGLFDWRRKSADSSAPKPVEARASVPDLLSRADKTRESGDVGAARSVYAEALAREPDNLYALYWLATLDFDGGRLAQSRGYCDRGLAIDPDQIGLLMRSVALARAEGDPLLAFETCVRIRALDPAVPDLDTMTADQLCSLGRISEGVATFDRALREQPDNVMIQSSRLFVLNYAQVLTPEALTDEHLRWGRAHESRLATERYAHRPRAAGARLRIAYVSPDLRDHAVAFFLAPLLRAHDRDRFDICCFHTVTRSEDPVSARLRQHATEWTHLPGATDAEVARAIHAARIDIAVDLAGHSSSSRLLAFARKPAPVQATWLGYLNTTGLSAVDYRITDAYLDPAGMTEALHAESLWRLPNQACFDPGADTPDVNPLPAAAGAPFTFGAVNQWSKVTDEMKATWARILVRMPQSRLLLIARGSRNPRMLALIREQFTVKGARPDQLEILDALPNRDFLRVFHRIDVALDTFPYGGGTTTLHSLWMGVPVITLAGRTPMSRNAVGPLTETGLADFVASSADDYVEIAIRLGTQRDRLLQVRRELRMRLQNSPIMDAGAYARNLERAYAEMWRERGVRV
jgi:predicted O-linked N-acetylglucosamine transferase (SPINDLY family)